MAQQNHTMTNCDEKAWFSFGISNFDHHLIDDHHFLSLTSLVFDTYGGFNFSIWYKSEVEFKTDKGNNNTWACLKTKWQGKRSVFQMKVKIRHLEVWWVIGLWWLKTLAYTMVFRYFIVTSIKQKLLKLDWKLV